MRRDQIGELAKPQYWSRQKDSPLEILLLLYLQTAVERGNASGLFPTP